MPRVGTRQRLIKGFIGPAQRPAPLQAYALITVKCRSPPVAKAPALLLRLDVSSAPLWLAQGLPPAAETLAQTAPESRPPVLLLPRSPSPWQPAHPHPGASHDDPSNQNVKGSWSTLVGTGGAGA